MEAAGEEGAIDALLLCGWYHAISYVARARLRLDRALEFPRAFAASSRNDVGGGPASRSRIIAAAASGVTAEVSIFRVVDPRQVDLPLPAQHRRRRPPRRARW